MVQMCRMCGPRCNASNLVSTLSTLVNGVPLRELFGMFTHVKFDKDPVLPQGICEPCRITLFKFIDFSRSIEDLQAELKLIPLMKNEDAGAGGIVIQTNQQSDCDQKLDPTTVAESDNRSSLGSTAGSSRSSFDELQAFKDYNLRKCSVVLEKTSLIYEPSDTESESSDSECDDERSGRKRMLDYSQESKSPNKRMRLIATSPAKEILDAIPIRPFAVSSFKPEAVEKRITIITTPEMLRYREIFDKELTEDIRLSLSNLNLPECGKEMDGRVKQDYAERFDSWSDIIVQCPDKLCKKKLEPYRMKIHIDEQHKRLKDVWKCSFDFCKEEFGFVKFCQHVIDKHHKYLSYRCLLCSSMFFNYATLHRHYQNAHYQVFNEFHICLRDGFLFESLEKLEEHLATHQRLKPRISFNNNDLNESQENVPKSNSLIACDVCKNSFNTHFDLQWHMLSHSGEQKFID